MFENVLLLTWKKDGRNDLRKHEKPGAAYLEQKEKVFINFRQTWPLPQEQQFFWSAAASFQYLASWGEKSISIAIQRMKRQILESNLHFSNFWLFARTFIFSDITDGIDGENIGGKNLNSLLFVCEFSTNINKKYPLIPLLLNLFTGLWNINL